MPGYKRPEDKHTEFIGLNTTPAMKALVEQYAAQEDLSQAEIMRTALSEFFSNHGVELAPVPKKVIRKRPRA